MAVAASFPDPLTDEEIERFAELFPHIHSEDARTRLLRDKREHPERYEKRKA
jgi:hypothetical protein